MSDTTTEADEKAPREWPIPPRTAITVAAAVVLFVLLGALIDWIVPAALAAGLVTAAAGYIVASRVTDATDPSTGLVTPPLALESRVEQALERLDGPPGPDRIRAAHELQRVAVADPSRANEISDLLIQHLEATHPAPAEEHAIVNILDALKKLRSRARPPG
jgi:hypothetical protein